MLSITWLFFSDAELFWDVSSQGEKMAEVRNVETAEQTTQTLEITAAFISLWKPQNCISQRSNFTKEIGEDESLLIL